LKTNQKKGFALLVKKKKILPLLKTKMDTLAQFVTNAEQIKNCVHCVIQIWFYEAVGMENFLAAQNFLIVKGQENINDEK
jgi:hypothetical protein